MIFFVIDIKCQQEWYSPTILIMGDTLKKKILIVEDESLIAADISNILRREGFEICAVVDNGQAAIDVVRTHAPDLILMDICLEGPYDGPQTASRIKVLRNIPIIFLSAFLDTETMIGAIETSPEGYLIKPFKRQDLIASIKLALHKSTIQSAPTPQHTPIDCGHGYLFDRHKHSLIRHGTPIKLTKKEMHLFDTLISKEGKVVSFSDIEYELWPDKTVSITSRRTLIHRLRSKLKDLDIRTIGGVGCVLNAPTPKSF